MFDHYVVFSLDEQRYALRLSVVERVVHAVHVTPLAKAPSIVLGIVSLQGRIVPVVDVRQRFRLPARESKLSDQIIFAHTKRRLIALWVDKVTGVIECSEGDVTHAGTILSGIDCVEGVIQLSDGLILLHDLDAFLSLDEEKSVDDALEEGQAV